MSVNADQSARRLKSLYDHWKAEPEAWNNVASFVVAAGPSNKAEEEISYRKSTAFQMRLFEYELPDTIMLMTPTEVHVVTGAKKMEFLKPVIEPWKTVVGVTLKMHEKPKGSDGKAQLLTLLSVAKEAGSPLGYIVKEEIVGPFCKLLDTVIKEDGIATADVTASLAMAMAPKDPEEVKDMKRASHLCTQVLEKCIVNKIEDVVDSEGKIKHVALSSLGETAALDPVKPPVEVKLKAENVNIAYPFVIQSGGEYDLKYGALPNEKHLQYDPLGVIVCRLGVKYKSYCGSIARTYLIDPTPAITKAYEALQKAQEAAIAAAVDGAKLSSIYEAARASIAASDEALVEHLTKNVGNVTGLELRELTLMISPKCERSVTAGTVLHIAVGLQNLVNEAAASDRDRNYALMIGDCVLVTKGGTPPELLTKAKVTVTDISYEIKGDEEEEEEEEVELQGQNNANVVFEGKTRGDGGRETEEAIRKAKQEELAKKKNQETLARLTEQSQRASHAASTSKASQDFVAFRSASEIVPHRGREGRVMVDDSHEAILLPIYGTLVPFHVGTIKNVQVITGDNNSIMRITFNVPGQAFGGAGWPPAVANPHCTFLREVSFRSSDSRHAEQVTAEIKNLRAKVKQKETERAERSTLVVQEKLRLKPASKGRVHALRDVWMRPAAGRSGKGRKMPGVLECHENGFRYSNAREESVDIIFSNIKHAFFQPGGKRETITLVHFHLHDPIMIGKKKTKDVQFFTEVMEAVQNLDGGRRSMLDPEELEEEQRERDKRNRINAEYQKFTRLVQEQWEKDHSDLDLEFDVPYPELGFVGVPYKTASWVIPTVNCLVDLIETPFLVITLKDIEVVNLERVGFGLKNFDMAIVFKDFQREVHKIHAIDVKHLDSIKEWMTRIKIKYYESKVNLNWKPILKTILDDPHDFIKSGGWEFLNQDQTDSDEEGEEDSEGYQPTEDESGDASSDDSDDSSMADSEEEESGSDASGSGEESEEEGKDWDELEKEAMEEDLEASDDDSEEDRRAKKRKGKGSAAPPPPAKKPKGTGPPSKSGPSSSKKGGGGPPPKKSKR